MRSAWDVDTYGPYVWGAKAYVQSIGYVKDSGHETGAAAADVSSTTLPVPHACNERMHGDTPRLHCTAWLTLMRRSWQRGTASCGNPAT